MMSKRPPRGILCEFWREGWESPAVCLPEQLAPEMNAIGLKWRLTGIGRMTLEAMPQSVRDQVESSGQSSFAWLQQLYSLGASASFSGKFYPGIMSPVEGDF